MPRLSYALVVLPACLLLSSHALAAGLASSQLLAGSTDEDQAVTQVLPRRALHAAVASQNGALDAGSHHVGPKPLPAVPVVAAVVGGLCALAIMTAMVAMCGLCGGDSGASTGGSIKWDDVTTDAKQDDGRFVQVFKGQWQNNRVAVKVPIGQVSQELRAQLSKEAKMMMGLQHPRTARVFGWVDDEQRVALVMQFHRGGTLEVMMTDHRRRQQYAELSLSKRLAIARQVAVGMKGLHDKNIVHGDLKTSNLLVDQVDSAYSVFISFSWVARAQRAIARTPQDVLNVLTPAITAPEVINNPLATLSQAADVYSFGIVLLEVMSGQLAWSKTMSGAQIFDTVRSGGRPDIPPFLAPVQQIITLCWTQEPSARPTFDDVVQQLQVVLEAVKTEEGDQGPDDTRMW